jgi:iron(III) transport system ATP-binding protein
VFQSYSLFPNMSVARNVGYGLECRRWSRADAANRIAELLALVGLEAHAEKYPHQLSGGQQQRVALARALAPRPAVLLLDEPLSALDAKVREELRAEIKELQSTLRITTVMVTHDQQEAMELADRIVLMNAGTIEQIGRPEDLYVRPATRFVAEFIGRMNVLPAAALGRPTLSGDGWIGVRPEAIELFPGPSTNAETLVATIRKCVYLGSCTRLVLAVDGRDLLVELRGKRTDLVPGRSIGVHIPDDAVHRFADSMQ